MRSFFSALRRRAGAQPPEISVVVVSYNMRREIPRTLRSLSIPYQKDISRSDYEIVLVDNGSERPWSEADFAGLGAAIRVINLRDAAPSPARAVNRGIAEARGSLVGVLIDGARMVTPGLLDACRRAGRLYPRPIVATLGFHLGFEHQSVSIPKGYGRDVEDRLLSSIEWPRDGYRLFEIAVLNASCAWGWFRPITESNALFMPAAMWKELGGYDEAFRLPGGGLANLDLYERALALQDSRLVMLLGEANFHQVHGGVASNSPQSGWNLWHEEYKRIRGRDYAPPDATPVYFGGVSQPALRHFDQSVRAARQDSADPAAAYIELLATAILNETGLGLDPAFPAAECPPELVMMRRKRMENVRHCVESAIRQGIAGDLVDCEMWNGGASIFMRGMLKAYGVRDRNVWVAGLPQGLLRPGAPTVPRLASSLDRVKSSFELFGLLDGQVRLLPGRFCDTLPQAPIERIAVLRVGGDLYSSTMDVLRGLYDRVSPGGFVIVDDCGASPGCARATDDFRRERGVAAPVQPIDGAGLFWRKDF